MNEVSNIKMVEGLRSLCERNEIADRLFTSFAARKNDASEMTVRRAAEIACSDHSSMINVLREVGSLGAGRFITGRHGYESRIAWDYSIRSLGKIAQGKSSLAEKVSSSALEEAASDAEKVATARHEYTLRKDHRVRLELPLDLTDREAERLSAFIKTLPM